MQADERRLKVLQAIVEDYVRTREPVGSKAVTERHNLDVSPATIRNDMAALEDIGLIHQPHTSAGRVPTEHGYRAFVDSISALKPLSAPEKRAIETLLDGATDFDDVLYKAGRLLAQLTNQVAVIQYPTRSTGALRHVEIIPASDTILLIIMITDSGVVEQRRVDVGMEVSVERALELSAMFNRTCTGFAGRELGRAVVDAVVNMRPEDRALGASIAAVLKEARLTTEEKIFTAGTANLARTNMDFQRSISPVLDALEEQVVLLRLFAEMTEELTISIGSENNDEGLSEASIVTSSYAGPARLGVVGPTRMDYPGTMVAVRAVARYVSRIIGTEPDRDI